MIFKRQYIIFFLSNVFLLLLLLFVANKANAGESIKIPDDFNSINEALAAASRFDTIIVTSGTYKENLFITQPVNIVAMEQVKLIAKEDKPAVTITTTHNVKLEGLEIIGGSEGIFITNSSGITVLRNKISGSRLCGIRVRFGSARIKENEIINNKGSKACGIHVTNTMVWPPSVISNNYIANNEHSGIITNMTGDIDIRSNIIHQNGNYGIEIREMSHAQVYENEISENKKSGIYVLDMSDATICRNQLISTNDRGNAAMRIEFHSYAELDNNNIQGYSKKVNLLLESALYNEDRCDLLATICEECDNPIEKVDDSFEQLHDLDQKLTAVLLREGFDDGIPEADNLPSIDDPLAQLGKKLFYTKLLGGDFDTACGSCHHPKLGGGDSLSLPIGVTAEIPDLLGPGRMHSETGFEFDSGPTVSRNSNSIFNIAFWKRTLFWDGRIEQVPGGIRTPDTALGRADSNAGPNLVTAQARFPFLARDEMRGHRSKLRLRKEELRTHIASRLHTTLSKSKDDTNWLEEFRFTFNKPKGKLSELITFDNIALAIAEFERSQIFVNTPFASYVQGDKTAISEEAKQGALLFFNTTQNGGAGCSSCHSGEFFTDEKFHVLAIPQIGRGKGDDDLFSNMSGAKKTDDFGRFRITGNPEDLYAFRTPTLLNVTATGPWGHSGAYTKLENIVRHHLNPNQALEYYDISQLFQKGLQLEDMMINTQNALEHLDVLRETNFSKLSITYLSEDEISDLLTFLKTLTDPCVRDSVCLEPWIDGDFKFTITSNIEQGVNYD